MLYAKGLVSKPVTFAANKLVIAVPANSTKIKSVAGSREARHDDRDRFGDRANRLLHATGAGEAGASPGSEKILANVRSEEPDVTGIVGKLTQGAVDAGFTYVTDVKATKGALRAIALPASLQPVVAYGVAVVKGAPHPAQAQAFISGLLNGDGQTDLRTAGFLPPPAQ